MIEQRMKNKRLETFFPEALRFANELSQLLSLAQDGLPAALAKQLSTLRGRLKRPEVRILLLGPLKSGKSSLMNVVAESPYVSQINQLPAYPCVVEVRDIDRDGSGSSEGSVFYKNGLPETAISLKEGRDRLDHLLRDYIRGGEAANVEYDRVVQQIDLHLAQDDLNLVLIDSPGVMFAKEGYSEATRGELEEADVAVFVIRPEQLFFQSIKEYLNDFAEQARTRRVFILVNVTTQAKTQRDGRFVDCDQTELKEELLQYFYHHIANESLNAALRRETDISIHFADLYIAGAATLDNDGEALKNYNSNNSETRRTINQIKAYIREEDLAAKKISDLCGKLDLAKEKGCEFLKQQLQMATAQLDCLNTRRAEQTKRLEQERGEWAKIRKTLEESNLSKTRSLERLSSLKHADVVDKLSPPDSPDPLRRQLASLASFSTEEAEQTQLHDVAERMNETVEKIYEHWRQGRLGELSLENLARVVWDEKVEDDCQSFRKEHQRFAVVGRDFEDCLRKALAHPEMQGSLASLSNPLMTAETIPPLQFDPVRSFWTGRWIGFGPADLWGDDGKRLVRGKFEEDILVDEKNRLVSQIVHAPWSLKAQFSADQLRNQAVGIVLKRLLPLLTRQIERKPMS